MADPEQTVTERIVPARLRQGDEVRVIAPSSSMAILSDEQRASATERLTGHGLKISLGSHVEECDDFFSSSIEHRVADLHAAFADPNVKAIITVIGGYNANQLLPHLDWDLIAANPKILCGYSDITALSCAITAMTGLVTYSGPHWSSFAMQQHFDQTERWFLDALFEGGRRDLAPAVTWSDDRWFNAQDDRTIETNEGHWVMNGGSASGSLFGGNLCTLNLLQGTPYMPDLSGAIVFVEDDLESNRFSFNRDLASLVQQPAFADVQALLIGRFQRESDIDRSTLTQILATQRQLETIPVIANVDFGHTDPLMTIPVGGPAHVVAGPNDDTALTIDFGEPS